MLGSREESGQDKVCAELEVCSDLEYLGIPRNSQSRISPRAETWTCGLELLLVARFVDIVIYLGNVFSNFATFRVG